MRKLPEHSPNSDLWSKIQQRKDFDSQVKMHASNLPEKAPKVDLWSSIEKELEQKTPVVPLWKYGMAAASIALILALCGISYLEFGRKDAVTPLTTEVSVKNPELNTASKIGTDETKSAVETPSQIEAEKSNTNVSEQKVNDRISPVTIELPTLDLPEIRIETSLISEVIIPPVPVREAPQTLHKVRISWGMQEKSKLQTKFGSSTPEDISNQQLGLANQPKNSIKINFHKQ